MNQRTHPSVPDFDGAALRLTQPLLKAEQAAELLAVKPSWIYEAVRAGTLPCLRIGRHIRFTQAMLESWLAEQCG